MFDYKKPNIRYKLTYNPETDYYMVVYRGFVVALYKDVMEALRYCDTVKPISLHITMQRERSKSFIFN